MNIFQKKFHPKRLNIKDIWKVHRLYTSDTPTSLLDTLDALYPKRRKTSDFSEVLVYTLKGLQVNGYSEFLNVVKGFQRGV